MRLSFDAITDEGNGQYTVRYTQTVAGEYWVRVSRGSVYIDGNEENNFPVTVAPGRTSASESMLSGEGVTTANAGYNVTFSVVARDAYGNTKDTDTDAFTFTIIVGDETVTGSCSPVTGQLGTYETKYLVTTAGTSSVTVTYAAEDVASSPYSGTVFPDNVAASGSTWSGEVDVEAGVQTDLYITARDQYGNVAYDSTEEEFQLVISDQAGTEVYGALATLYDEASVRYRLSYAITVAGTYVMVIDHATGDVVRKTVTVSPGVADEPNSQLLGLPDPDTVYRSGVEIDTVIFIMRDVYGNTITDSSVILDVFRFVLSKSGGGSDFVPFYLNETTVDGESGFAATFTPRAPGTLRVEIYLDGARKPHVGGDSPYEVSVGTGYVSSAASTVTGSGFLSGAVAGTAATFYIQARDQDGYAIDYELSAEDDFNVGFSNDGVTSSQSYLGSGLYEVTYTAPEADSNLVIFVTQGSLNLQVNTTTVVVYSSDTVITHNPASTSVHYTQSDQQAVQASGTLSECESGGSASFFVQLKSAQGLDVTSLGAALLDVAGMPEARVTNITTERLDDLGRWKVTFTGKKTGAVTWYLTVDGTELGLYYSDVVPGPTAASTSTISGAGLTTATAGTSSTFTIVARDAYGNDAQYDAVQGMDKFYIVATAPSGASVSGVITKNEDDANTYTASYTPTESGTSTVRVTLGGEDGDQVGELHNVHVANGAVSYIVTVPSAEEIAAAPPVVVGVVSPIVVYAYDAYGNNHTAPALEFVVTLTSEEAGVSDIQVSAKGTTSPYRTDITSLVQGTFKATLSETVQYGGAFGDPLTVSFQSGGAVAAKTFISGDGLVDSDATHLKKYFTISLRDKYGNEAVSSSAPSVFIDVDVASGALDYSIGSVTCPSDGCVQSSTYTYNVSYVPYQAGVYSVRVELDGTAIGDGQPTTVSMQFAQAPVVDRAQFQDSLGSIHLTFDRATDQGGLSGTFDCASVLDDTTVAKLGTDPQCSWGSNSSVSWTYLVMTLGNGATISPETTDTAADSIVIRESVLRNEYQNSFFVDSSARVEKPENPLQVVATLSAPTSVGVCDAFQLDAGDSSGAGGRALKYTYAVTANTDVNALSKKLYNSADSTAINIVKSDMEAGIEYTFKVKVSNFIEEESTATATVTRQEVPIPRLSIAGPNPLDVKSSDSVSIKVDADQPDTDCEEADSSVNYINIDYTWSLVSGPAVNFSVGDQATTYKTTKLTISPYTLESNTEYVFQITGELKESPGRTTTATANVNVGYYEIEVDGCLGPDRSHDRDLDLELTASPTDPGSMSSSSGETYPWEYVWGCYGFCEGTAEEPCEPQPSDQECFNDDTGVLLENSDTITIPKYKLARGYIFRFYCDIQREPILDGRRKTEYVDIYVSRTTTFPVTAERTTDPSVTKVSASDKTTLACSADTDLSVQYEWVLVSGDLAAGKTSFEEMLVASYGVQSAKEAEVTIASYMLSTGQTYTFKCQVRETSLTGDVVAGGASAFATVDVTVNSAPSGGSLSVRWYDDDSQSWLDTETIGTLSDEDGDGVDDTLSYGRSWMELASEFQLNAADWADEDTPLTYSFQYRLVSDTELTPLSAAQQSSKLGCRLLSSTESAGALPRLLLLVTVSDSFGDYAEYTFPYYFSVQPYSSDNAVTQNYLSRREQWDTDDAASRRRRRALLQDSGDSSVSDTAALLKEMVFDPAIGKVDSDETLQFVDIWSRTYGVYGVDYSTGSSACDQADEAVRKLKNDIVDDVAAQDASVVADTTYVSQFTCSMLKPLWKPGEVGEDQLWTMMDTIHTRKIIPLVTNYYLYDAGITSKKVRLNDKTQECFSEYLNAMLRLTDVACESPTRERNETRMVALYYAVEDLGVAMAQRLSSGEDALSQIGDYVTISSSRARVRGPSSSRTSDFQGSNLASDRSTIFAFEGSVLNCTGAQSDGADCENRQGVEPGSLLDVISYTYTNSDEGNSNYLNPLPPFAEDARVYGHVSGVKVEIVNITAIVGDLSREQLEEARRNIEQFKQDVTSLAIQAYARRVATDVTLDFKDYAFPEAAFDTADYLPGVRYFPEVLSDYLEGVPIGLVWENEGVAMTDVDGLQARATKTRLAMAWSPYVEERPPALPPPPPPPPAPTPPPPPPYFYPPLPLAPQVTNELDVGIVIAPILAGISLCSYVIYVFVRRRRLLQEIAVDFDELLE